MQIITSNKSVFAILCEALNQSWIFSKLPSTTWELSGLENYPYASSVNNPQF